MIDREENIDALHLYLPSIGLLIARLEIINQLSVLMDVLAKNLELGYSVIE